MSRRKQSNPKPIKRQSEDSLESIAALLRLPLDVFRVRDPQDDVREYTLYTGRTLRSGTTFGPYRGRLLAPPSAEEEEDEDEEEEDPLLRQHPSFETKGEDGEDALFVVTDESGGWLKLLRPVHSSDDPHNAAVFHNGSSAWCTITSDLESDTELLVRHRWTADLSPRDRLQEGRKDAQEHPSPPRLHQHRRRSPNAYCDMLYNGRLSVDVKCEPSSPATPPSSASGIPGEDHGTEDAPAYLNGSNYAPAFPCGGTTPTSKTDGPLRCEQCDTFFNSRRILDVHQSYYCRGRAAAAAGSDTDTEEGAAPGTVKTETNAVLRSPGTSSEHGDTTSPPPTKDAAPADGRPPSPGHSARRRPVDAPSSSTRPPFRCQHCGYSTDKRASLTRHLRMHGGAGARASCEGPPLLPTPPTARYCANCDIQFASYKNYQVHKEFYCNTRHVHKSVTSSSSSPGVQQPRQSPSPGRTTATPPPPQCGGTTTTTSSSLEAKPGYNVVLNHHPHHQPLYAAISTSPLILVPCSYVAGAGGLSTPGGLIPAGNIVIPNPHHHQQENEDSSSSSTKGSVIPTFTVPIPDGSVADEDDPPRQVLVPRPEDRAARRTDAASSPKGSKDVSISRSPPPPPVRKEEGAEQPLDLSFRKREGCEAGARRASPHPDPGSRRSSSPPACEDLSSGAPPSLPPMPLLNPDAMVRAEPPLLAPPVLVKQGASKCADCNIVFYKHENYLVHRSKYCAARTGAGSGPDSPGGGGSRDDSDREESSSGRTNHHKSPVSSPRVGNSSRTPPAGDEPCEALVSPAVQYYCVACGIKYTSLDNLRAHQFYYCPKRSEVVQPLALPYAAAAALQQQQQQQLNPAGREHRCGKCKNAYPTEELLRQHPCAVQRKCPYCDVYCPTLSAAQRHLVTHTGIKSFRCSLCGYKGHTLRGMRTHIRIHLDKGSATPEEAYILCVDEGGAEIGCAGNHPPPHRKSATRAHQDRIKSVIATEPPEVVPVSPVSPAVVVPQAGVLPADLQLTVRAADDPVATGDATHWCQICGYSSSYKGNVVRHVKLVHKDLVSTQAMSNAVTSRPADGLPPGTKHHPAADADLSAAGADHSNSSSGLDSKPVVLANGKATDDVKPPLAPLKNETPTSPKGVKRPLSAEDGGGGGPFKSGPKYCKSCDISFNFLSNFLAHKKFYCTPRLQGTGGEATSQESAVQPVQ